VYLPQDEMHRFGVSDETLARRTADPAFAELMKFEIARARDLYARGGVGLPMIPNDGSRFTAAVMSTVYGGILNAIEKQHFDVFSERAHLSTFQKLNRLTMAYRLANA
jgi:phytoene synthase